MPGLVQLLLQLLAVTTVALTFNVSFRATPLYQQIQEREREHNEEGQPPPKTPELNEIKNNLKHVQQQ